MMEDNTLPRKRLRMLEFFSGIGGMRAALDQALDVNRQRQQAASSSSDNKDDEPTPPNFDYQLDEENSQAYEINRDANQVYRRNFPSSRVTTKLVEQLTVQNVAHFDLWTLSPPCQPFTNTRFAKQHDLADPRTAGFVAILQLLEQLHPIAQPRFVFLENVQGFLGSQARGRLLETLRRCHYTWKEYVVSPMELGIPNHRKRYYILCEASSSSDRFSSSDDDTNVHYQLDEDIAQAFGFGKVVVVPTTNNDNGNDNSMAPEYPPRTISEYLDDNSSDSNTEVDDFDSYGIDRDTLAKPWASDLPLVGPSDTHSHCFTAFYSRQIHKSTGSLLLLDESIPSVAAALADNALDRSDMTKFVGKIRRFSPSELLRLFGFPPHFALVDDDDDGPLRLQTQYKLIGNSINVTVVSILLYELIVLSNRPTTAATTNETASNSND